MLESVDVLNGAGITSQEASALIVVTQHYDTLQAIGEKSGSKLILLPNTPTQASEMLNTMVTSFTAAHELNEHQITKEDTSTRKGNKPNQGDSFTFPEHP